MRIWLADRCFIDNSSTSVDLLSSDTKTAESQVYKAFRYLFRAETVGFEPTCRLPDKLISSQPRYDHFDTSPICAGCDRPINFIRSPRKIKGIFACQPAGLPSRQGHRAVRSISLTPPRLGPLRAARLSASSSPPLTWPRPLS